jgi:hypothetical protein
MFSEPKGHVGACEVETNIPFPATDTESIPSHPVDNFAEAGNSTTSVCSKGKKHQCTPSRAVTSVA